MRDYLLKALKDPETRARVLMVNIRTRYVDQWLEDAVKAGAKQVVILGAGFDSRAYRLRQMLKDTRVFEVDFGPTQEYKRRRIAEVAGPATQGMPILPATAGLTGRLAPPPLPHRDGAELLPQRDG